MIHKYVRRTLQETSMTNTAQMPRACGTVVSLIAAATIASVAPNAAAAQDYDIDCKLILCLPGGFPSGCRDAYRHMIDRLRDGKSPIGFCAMNDGTEYDAYNIDFNIVPATSSRGWECPTGKNLFHTTRRDGSRSTRQVQTFCYDRAYSYGYDEKRYTNITRPTRTDLEVNLTVEPGTPEAFSRGWQRFETGIARDPYRNISYRP
jgi:hypothetical protein